MATADEDNHADPLRDELLDHLNQGSSHGRIVDSAWAGGMEQQMASAPRLRVGQRWFNTIWLLPITCVGLVIGIAVCQQLRTYQWMQDFISQYPGTSTSYAPTLESGFPWWLRWQHLFNSILMMFIIRAGLQILVDHPRLYLTSGSTPGRAWLRLRGLIPADRRDSNDARRVWKAKDDSVALPKWLGLPGIRHSIGLARSWHFGAATFWVVNGVIFYVLLFATGQWQRIVPTSLDVIPNAISTGIQYLSLTFPNDHGFTEYNGLQLIAYFVTVFVAAPLAIITGFLQAPAVAGKLGLGHGWLNRQVVRSIHFGVLAWMLIFVVMHVVMVFATGLLGNLNHIMLGTNTQSWWALALFAIWMGVLIFLWLWASPFTLAHPRMVQQVGLKIFGWLGWLLESIDPRATYAEKDISSVFWPNGEPPTSEKYRHLLETGFVDYRLRIDGMVENPVELSLADLRAMPKREQITQHYCIQGWSGIAKWGGAAMADLVDLVRPTSEARWVVFYSFSDGPVGGRYYDCHPIRNMAHELTILAYEMNDEPLIETYGAPVRLRDEVELGFKQVKWVESIEFVASFEHLGAGHGGYNEDQEFYGYRMPM